MNTKRFLRSFSALLLLGMGSAQALTQTKEESSLRDAAVAPFQQELLDLAFQAASAFPTNPHIKNRARTQEEVVASCLKLDQARRALECIEKIDNWRQGAAYADLAFHLAERGHLEQVSRLLNLANAIAEKPLPASEDEPEAKETNWQRDRIRIKIARVHALLGQAKEAAQFEKDAGESERGKLDAVRAKNLKEEEFTRQIEAIKKTVEAGNFDLTRNALESCAQLFDRFFADAEKRAKAEKTIKDSWGKLPLTVRIELLISIAESSTRHGDSAKALALLDEAGGILEKARMRTEDRVAISGQLARRRASAGDTKGAREAADRAYAAYLEDRENVVDIYRARALRPVAEAYFALGDKETALAVYSHAAAEGLVNPNSRPRAEDLSAICRSMAEMGAEPDTELWRRLRVAVRSLGQPW